MGNFEILELLGRGGMGEVYRARDSRLKREVAIKMLPPVFAGRRDRIERSEREARSAAAVNHPNICISTCHHCRHLRYTASFTTERTPVRFKLGYRWLSNGVSIPLPSNMQ